MNWLDFIFGIIIGATVCMISESVHQNRLRLARLDKFGRDPRYCPVCSREVWHCQCGRTWGWRDELLENIDFLESSLEREREKVEKLLELLEREKKETR
jgi:hypothetical protein